MPGRRGPAAQQTPLTRRVSLLLLALVMTITGVTAVFLHYGSPSFEAITWPWTKPSGLDPRAPLDPHRLYHLVVWDYRLPFTSQGGAVYAEASRQVIEDFERRYPNLTVDLHLVDLADGPSKLAEALAAGYPPDVYCSPFGPPAVGSELQIPLGLYLDYETWIRFEPVAWQTVKIDGLLWALPRWLMIWPWLGNRDLLREAGLDPDLISETGWTRDELAAAAASFAGESDRTDGAVFLDTVAPATALRDLLFARHLAATETPTAEGFWLGTEPAEAVAWLAAMRDQGGSRSESGREVSRAIDTFLHGKTAVLAGVVPWATTFLLEAGRRPAPSEFRLPERGAPPAMVLLPPPGDSGQPAATWVSAATITVFRQARYRGDDNTRLAAELALALTEGLSPWLRDEILCLPVTSSELASWQLRAERSGAVGAVALESLERLRRLPEDRLNQALAALNYGPRSGEAGSNPGQLTQSYLGPFLETVVAPAATRFWRGEIESGEMLAEIAAAMPAGQP